MANNVVKYEGNPLDNPAFKKYLDEQESSSNILPKSEVTFCQDLVHHTDVVEKVPEFAFAEFNPQLVHNHIRLEEVGAHNQTLAHFTKLMFCHKWIIGTFPPTVSGCKHLKYINISYNKFHGRIPPSLFECLTLEELWLDHNEFEGRIPAGIGNLQQLREVSFAANNLSGRVPESIFQLKGLKRINLKMNEFQGLVELETKFTGGVEEIALMPECELVT
jgi:hypothetical protein